MEACFAMKLKKVYLWLFISEFWLESELWDLVYILQFWVLRIILHVSNLNFISTTGNLYLTILTFLLSIVSLYLASIYLSVRLFVYHIYLCHGGNKLLYHTKYTGRILYTFYFTYIIGNNFIKYFHQSSEFNLCKTKPKTKQNKFIHKQNQHFHSVQNNKTTTYMEIGAKKIFPS